MAILNPPSSFCGPLNTTFMLSPLPTISPVSSFNQRSTVSGPISEFWRAQIVVHGTGPGSITDAGWRDTAAFLMSLRGGENRARLFDARRYPMRGAGGALPTLAVDDDYAAGVTTIRLRGLTSSQLVAIAADDHFGIGENLYTAQAHSGSDAGGKATITFLPPLRAGVANGDSVQTVKPTGAFRLIGGFMDMSIPHYQRSRPMTLEFFEDPEFEE